MVHTLEITCNYEDHVETWGNAQGKIRSEQQAGTLCWSRSPVSSKPFLGFLCPALYVPGLTPDSLGLTSGSNWGWGAGKGVDNSRTGGKGEGRRKGASRALLPSPPSVLGGLLRNSCILAGRGWLSGTACV